MTNIAIKFNVFQVLTFLNIFWEIWHTRIIYFTLTYQAKYYLPHDKILLSKKRYSNPEEFFHKDPPSSKFWMVKTLVKLTLNYFLSHPSIMHNRVDWSLTWKKLNLNLINRLKSKSDQTSWSCTLPFNKRDLKNQLKESLFITQSNLKSDTY